MNSNVPLRGVITLGLALCTILVFGRLPDVHAEPSSQGIPIILLRNCTHEEELNRGDSRDVWVILKSDGSAYINEDRVSPQQLPNLIGNMMEARMNKIIWLAADTDLEYGRVVRTAGQILQKVPEGNFLLVTSSNLSTQYPCLVPNTAVSWRIPDTPRKFATTILIQ